MNDESYEKIRIDMHQTIEFTCHSDDVFSVQVSLIERLNIDAVEDTKTKDRYCFHLSNKDEEIKVVAHYSHKGIWSIGVEPIEKKPLPVWDVRFITGSNDYSPSLLMTVPINTVITSGDNKLEFAEEVINYFNDLRNK